MLFNITKQLSNFNYNSTDSFELLPTLYNGTIKIPVTIETNTVYLASSINYGDITIRFIGYDMNGISMSQLENKLFDDNFKNKFYNDYSIACFSRIYPITTKMKAYINAYFACLKYYECLYLKLGRTGLLNTNHDLIFFVNIDMTNSFWYESYIFFGNGSGDILPLTSVDICAHELTHGLIDNTIDLVYRGESGAMNEAIADIFGVFVEFYINSSIDIPDWTIGEQVQNKVQNGGFRNFENPLTKKQPDSYMGRYWANPNNLLIDNGGVHINSGVLNFFCYLSSNGKLNYTNSLGYKINIKSAIDIGFSLDDFVKITYNLMINEEPKSIKTFKQFGELFLKYTQSLKYSSIIMDHINQCLNATNLLYTIIPKSNACCEAI